VQFEAQFRIHDREASTDLNDVKARRARRPREAVDRAVRHTPGAFQHLVRQIPENTKGIEVGM
jgi:hypothetical protein